MKDNNFFGLKLNREFFIKFSRLIKEKSGLFFDLSKMYFLETRIKKRMQERGIRDFVSYYNLLKTDYSDREFKELLNEITIHETSFFRLNPQFQAFSDFVLSELIGKKRDLNQPYLTFLSAGCSTGEEAYSIAISVFEKIRGINKLVDFSVLGVDISVSVIEKARRGVYKERELEGMPEDILAKYFEKVGDNYKVRDFVKEKVLFKYANLYNEEDMSALGRFDTVFCRYVLIYFDEMAKMQVLDNLYSAINPGGYLIVAPSESYNISDRFAKVSYKNSIVFMRPL